MKITDEHKAALRAVWDSPARFYRDEQNHIVGPDYPYHLLPSLEKAGMVAVDPIFSSYKPKREDAKGIVVQITALGMKVLK